MLSLSSVLVLSMNHQDEKTILLNEFSKVHNMTF